MFHEERKIQPTAFYYANERPRRTGERPEQLLLCPQLDAGTVLTTPQAPMSSSNFTERTSSPSTKTLVHGALSAEFVSDSTDELYAVRSTTSTAICRHKKSNVIYIVRTAAPEGLAKAHLVTGNTERRFSRTDENQNPIPNYNFVVSGICVVSASADANFENILKRE